MSDEQKPPAAPPPAPEPPKLKKQPRRTRIRQRLLVEHLAANPLQGLISAGRAAGYKGKDMSVQSSVRDALARPQVNELLRERILAVYPDVARDIQARMKSILLTGTDRDATQAAKLLVMMGGGFSPVETHKKTLNARVLLPGSGKKAVDE